MNKAVVIADKGFYSKENLISLNKDYLFRIISSLEEYNMEKFNERQHQFGTIALLHNLDKSEEAIFIDYKRRMQIETMIDALKNVLEADSSYMHDEQSMETWMLINYIALVL